MHAEDDATPVAEPAPGGRWRAPRAAAEASGTTRPGRSIGVGADTTDELIEALKSGLPAESFDRLQEQLDVSARELADVVGIASRTLARRKRSGRFAPDESERVLRIARLYERAAVVLGGEERAQRWLKQPKRALGGRDPLHYADTEPGAREVEDLLGRLEHGVFS